MKRARKYAWPENPEDIREYDDEVLKKLWRYAPPARTKNECEGSMVLANELVSRGLK